MLILVTCSIATVQNVQHFDACCCVDASPELRGLLQAIPVPSCGVNLLEDPYQLHVMFAFTAQSCQLAHSLLNTSPSSTLDGCFYLKR